MDDGRGKRSSSTCWSGRRTSGRKILMLCGISQLPFPDFVVAGSMPTDSTDIPQTSRIDIQIFHIIFKKSCLRAVPSHRHTYKNPLQNSRDLRTWSEWEEIISQRMRVSNTIADSWFLTRSEQCSQIRNQQWCSKLSFFVKWKKRHSFGSNLALHE